MLSVSWMPRMLRDESILKLNACKRRNSTNALNALDVIGMGALDVIWCFGCLDCMRVRDACS